MIERTFVMIKPDCVKRALVGDIIKRFENIGLKSLCAAEKVSRLVIYTIIYAFNASITSLL